MSNIFATYMKNSRSVHDPFATDIDELLQRADDLYQRISRDSMTNSSDIHLGADLVGRLLETSVSAVSFNWIETPIWIAPKETKTNGDTTAIQRAKNEAALRLLREWISDESNYDEKTWPKLKKAIEENRLSHRKRFND